MAEKTPAKTAKTAPQGAVGVEKKAKPLTASQRLDAVGIDAICEKVANCETLQSIADGVGVSKWSLIQWINDDRNHDAHARARERGADKHAEDILAIADEIEIEATYQGEEVRLDISSSAVARNRLRVDTRKWLAAKMNAKKYGDKTVTELSGVDGAAIKHSVAMTVKLDFDAIRKKMETLK